MIEAIIQKLKKDPGINVFKEIQCSNQNEYEALKEYLREADADLFSRYPQILLFFISQFMRREVFKKGRLWSDLWPCIGRPENTNRYLYEKLAKAISRMGIELIRDGYNGRRLFVETFWREVGITTHNAAEFLEIFWWYFDNYYPKIDFDEKLFAKNHHYYDFEEQFYLISDAVDKLIAIVELLQDPALPLIESYNDTKITELKRILHEKLGFDPLQILPSEEYIFQVYIRSLNYVTPSKFRQITAYKKTAKIMTPWGKPVPSHTILSDTNIAFGKYVVAGKTYNISPHPKINLRSMTAWEINKIIQPLPGFVGYRSKKLFTVRRNNDVLEPAEYYMDGSLQGYVWCGRIPVGGSLFIDNKEVPPLEGIQWQPILKLRWPDAEKGIGPELEIELGALRVNEPALRGKKVEIRVGDFRYATIVRMTGSCRIDVPAVRLAPIYEADTAVQIVSEDRVVIERNVRFDDVMLFSSSTRGKISKKRKWTDDFRFYLFSVSTINAESVKGAEVRDEYQYGKYHVYEILRTSNELRIGEGEEYEILEQEFIQLKLEEDKTTDPIVIYKPTEMSIRALTNISEVEIRVEIHLYRDVELIRSRNYDVKLNRINSTLNSFIIDGKTIFDKIPYGRYTVVVHFDTVKSNPIAFLFIPQPEAIYGDDHTYMEGETIVVTAKWKERLVDSLIKARVEQRFLRNKIIFNPVALEAKFDLFKEGIVDFPARYTYVFSPTVFGIRLLQQNLIRAKEVECILSHPERNDLKNAVLYAFGRPQAKVNVSLNQLNSTYELDENGELRVPLSYLADELNNSINILSVCSEGLEQCRVIRWWPRVEGLPKLIRLHTSIYYEVSVSGPSDAALEVRTTDIYGAVHRSVRHNLTGKTTAVNGYLHVASGIQYITFGYIVEGEYLPTHLQYRVPIKGILCGAGIGISSEKLIGCVGDFIRVDSE
jgi:hypothetical protein